MRSTQGLKDFLFKWSKESLPSKEILYEYRPFCVDLMFNDEELVRETTDILKRNITEWAKRNSPAAARPEGIVSKDHLLDKSLWYVDSMIQESMPMATSGSTNGFQFSYLRWEPFLYFIEAENHYDLIMDEFSVADEPDILYFFNTRRFLKERLVTVSSESDNFMEHHGLKRRARVHYVNWDMFQKDRRSYLCDLSSYLRKEDMDVIFASGPSINSLCRAIAELNEDPFEVCRLLSNSNERILPSDIEFLLNGRVGEVCDHMRCWDGGATFFTCRKRNYHLMDNLSWCVEIDDKLVCTDYFSLPSPFVNYWNGDFCRISDTYRRCGCGRLYRDFKFLDNRPFSVKGKSILEVKEALMSLKVIGIKYVRCSRDHVEIVSCSEISKRQKAILRSRFNFEFRFLVER